jgi:hypothetical protein
LNGREGIRAMCNQKSVLTDRLPLHRAIRLYPVKKADYTVAKSTIGLLYRRGVTGRLRALADLVRVKFPH